MRDDKLRKVTAALHRLTDFTINTLAVTLVFMSVSLIVCQILCRLLGIRPLSGVVIFIFSFPAAVLFVALRDYTEIL